MLTRSTCWLPEAIFSKLWYLIRVRRWSSNWRHNYCSRSVTQNRKPSCKSSSRQSRGRWKEVKPRRTFSTTRKKPSVCSSKTCSASILAFILCVSWQATLGMFSMLTVHQLPMAVITAKSLSLPRVSCQNMTCHSTKLCTSGVSVTLSSHMLTSRWSTSITGMHPKSPS